MTTISERLMRRSNDEWLNPAYTSPDGRQIGDVAVPQQTTPATLTIPAAPQPETTPVNSAAGTAKQPPKAPEGISGENLDYLTGIGFSPADIQQAAAGYTPEKGGFIQHIYESARRRPEEPDGDRLGKLRNRSAVADALGLVAQLAAAAGGGDVRERKFSETATAMSANAERDLREEYALRTDGYNRGLSQAISEDYKTGYNKYLDTRKAILSALENKRKSEQQTAFENLRSENGIKQLDIREKGLDRRHAEDIKARRDNLIYTQRQQNIREGIKQEAKGRASVKTVIFPVTPGTPGAITDRKTQSAYIPLDLSAEQYSVLAQEAEKAIADALTTDPMRFGNYIPDVSKLNNDQAIQLYVRYLKPEILYDENGDLTMDRLRRELLPEAKYMPRANRPLSPPGMEHTVPRTNRFDGVLPPEALDQLKKTTVRELINSPGSRPEKNKKMQ